MTKDIVVITDRNQTKFTNEVFKVTKELEGYGYDVDIKFSTTEGNHNEVVYSALILAYAEEE